MSKYITAMKISRMGKYPESFRAIWDSIPDVLLNSCTGGELARIVDLCREQYLKGHSDGYYAETK